MSNKICDLFEIQYPIIQGGMVWCSSWELASSVSNAGGLGLIGSGSMKPEILLEHIRKCKQATNKPFGVNVPLLRTNVEEIIKVIIDEGVKIVFTSAGNPMTWTSYLKSKGIKVAHVVANTKFAKKCIEAGVDAIVAEGFEAGGHNGREETTTMVLVPHVRKTVDIPLIAAGGIASGRAMLAAMALGADGVQIGSAFAVASESSAHEYFKQKIIDSKEGDTVLTLKQIAPTRLIRNKFYESVQAAENRGASSEEMKQILGKGRSKLGIFDGNMDDGEIEIGQVSAMINSVKPAAKIISDIVSEYIKVKKELCSL